MRHLVMGGTGTVGRLVVEGLLKKGESVRVLTRDAGNAKTQPKGAASVTPAQLQETRTIVGHEPRKFSDFVKETAASWK